MITRIENVILITDLGLIPNSALDIEKDKIYALYEGYKPANPADVIIDGKGDYLSPGFIDIHVHGGGGVEFMSARNPLEIKKGVIAHARRGTTTIIPTTLAGNIDDTIHMIKMVKEAKAKTKECTIAGVHLEGPFLSPKQAGAQSKEALLEPSIEILDRLCDAWPEGIRLMGVAVELPSAMELGEELFKRGIKATIAHSDADYNCCMEASRHHYHDITHIYSGCSSVKRIGGFRFGGVVEAGLLEDDFTVQVIADGCHLPEELLRLIYKNKGVDRISLITDALFPAGTDYEEGSILIQANGMETVLEDGVMKMMDRQAFCGSIATMDRLIRNMVNLGKVPLHEAVKMASATPARVAGIKNKGSIRAGFDADLVLLDKALMPRKVFARGVEIVS